MLCGSECMTFLNVLSGRLDLSREPLLHPGLKSKAAESYVDIVGSLFYNPLIEYCASAMISDVKTILDIEML